MTLSTFDQPAALLHPELDVWIVRRLLAGMKPQAIAAATGGAVTERTVYRWRRTITGIEEIRVGSHVATFVLRAGMPPARITPWSEVPSGIRRARAFAGQRCGRWMPFNRERCGRLAGHRTNCKSRAALDAAAQVERERRARGRRARQRATA